MMTLIVFEIDYLHKGIQMDDFVDVDLWNDEEKDPNLFGKLQALNFRTVIL